MALKFRLVVSTQVRRLR